MGPVADSRACNTVAFPMALDIPFSSVYHKGSKQHRSPCRLFQRLLTFERTYKNLGPVVKKQLLLTIESLIVVNIGRLVYGQTLLKS